MPPFHIVGWPTSISKGSILPLNSVPQDPFLNVRSFARVVTLTPCPIRWAILQGGQQRKSSVLGFGTLPPDSVLPSLCRARGDQWGDQESLNRVTKIHVNRVYFVSQSRSCRTSGLTARNRSFIHSHLRCVLHLYEGWRLRTLQQDLPQLRGWG